MRCSICNQEMTHPTLKNYLGNNPFPIRTDENARCCDSCNENFVIPARIIALTQEVKPWIEQFNKMNFDDLTKTFNAFC